MRLTEKIRKVATGNALKSAQRHSRRLLKPRRGPAQLDAETIMATIDQEQFDIIRRRYQVDDPGGDPPKYLDWRTWLAYNVRRIRALDLDRGRARRVLDLGCGSGYFLYICKLLGHEILGLDVGDMQMFNEMTRVLAVPRVIWRIKAFEPLPDLGAPFDAVSAHLICFNDHKHANLWGPAEWDFFLDDLKRHLRPRAQIWFELNQEWDGTYHTPELKAFFEKRGAIVNDNQVIFRAPPRSLVSA